MGVLERRFLNLIVPGRSPGVKMLRRIDLTGNQLFYRDGSEKPAAAAARGSSMAPARETIQFADPSFTFRAAHNDWPMSCFPLADYSECKLLCADLSGRGFVFDLDSPKVGTIPALLRKLSVTPSQPISVFVHKPQVDGDLGNYSNGSGLFLMEKSPHPEARRGTGTVHDRVQEESDQFVGLINHRSARPGTGKSWHCHRLPPPPFVLGTMAYDNGRTPEITAYGVVGGGGGGSHVCISVDGVGVSTYCLDTDSLKWGQAGEWTHPFHGKVEYVPQLKLWFGFSAAADAGRHHLAAADLSGMLLDSCSSHPQRLVGGPWQELVGPPEEWKECKDPQFVSLGSGRFCIARFFLSQETEEGTCGDQVAHKNFTVLTGVEVSRCGGKGEGGTGKVELQMTPHISRRINNTNIETLF